MLMNSLHRTIVAGLAVGLILAACNSAPAAQPVTPTLPPIVAATATPAALPTAVVPPTQPPAQPPAPIDFALHAWPSVVVSYDSTLWQTGHWNDIQAALLSRQIPGCEIAEGLTTTPPREMQNVTIGGIGYAVAETVVEQKRLDWYIAISGPDNLFTAGSPTLIVSEPPEQVEACLTVVYPVLATLHTSTP